MRKPVTKFMMEDEMFAIQYFPVYNKNGEVVDVGVWAPDYSKLGVKEAVEKDVDDIVDNSIDRGY